MEKFRSVRSQIWSVRLRHGGLRKCPGRHDGAGDPWAVTRKVEGGKAGSASSDLRLHFHDTRNTGLANAFAGIEAGIDVLTRCRWNGGCPFAPGARHIATEIWSTCCTGRFRNGYDLEALSAQRWIGDRIGCPAPSALSRAVSGCPDGSAPGWRLLSLNPAASASSPARRQTAPLPA
jgi:hypothetical protein